MLVAMACVVGFLGVAVTSWSTAVRDWPPFLRASAEYPPDIATTIERLWLAPTFTRTVAGDPASVPLALLLKFVDTPDVAAGVARHLGLTTYDVITLGADWYEAGDGNRTHGVYRVLMRDGGRRVILSWGTHRSPIVGAISGSALTRLEFADDEGRTVQRLVVNVIVDNRLAAGITRPILLLFGRLVDRKLAEAFRTVSAAALWAQANPDHFCGWLDGAVATERRAELRDVFDQCGAGRTTEPPGRSRDRGLPRQSARDVVGVDPVNAE